MTLSIQQIPPRALRSLGAVLLPIDHLKIVFGVTTTLGEWDNVVDLMDPGVELLPRGSNPLRNYATTDFRFGSPLPLRAKGEHESRSHNRNEWSRRLELRITHEDAVENQATNDGDEKFSERVEEMLPSSPQAHEQQTDGKRDNEDKHRLEGNFVHEPILSERRSVGHA
jgi:hypothetical protein